MDNTIENTIQNADLILVGIGEECDSEYPADNISLNDGIVEMYRRLKQQIQDKNYFIISVCMDGRIHEVGFKEERIVEPCGGYRYLQCEEKCTNELYPVEQFPTIDFRKNMPVCPKCGKQLVFNNVKAANYLEEGYMVQWQHYTKWLQGTVNRKVCIIELGVGVTYPTVIRWPFEKIAFFNQKAVMYRIHSSLYQITEEAKDRSFGLKMNPADFLK